jgi:hypothetical protein
MTRSSCQFPLMTSFSIHRLRIKLSAVYPVITYVFNNVSHSRILDVAETSVDRKAVKSQMLPHARTRHGR